MTRPCGARSKVMRGPAELMTASSVKVTVLPWASLTKSRSPVAPLILSAGPSLVVETDARAAEGRAGRVGRQASGVVDGLAVGGHAQRGVRHGELAGHARVGHEARDEDAEERPAQPRGGLGPEGEALAPAAGQRHVDAG